MTIEETKAVVEKIREVGNYDPESAHMDEDSLMIQFIKAISKGEFHSIMEAKLIADEVLKTRELGFPRWTA